MKKSFKKIIFLVILVCVFTTFKSVKAASISADINYSTIDEIQTPLSKNQIEAVLESKTSESQIFADGSKVPSGYTNDEIEARTFLNKNYGIDSFPFNETRNVIVYLHQEYDKGDFIMNTFTTSGTCSRAINFEVEGEIIKSVNFVGGCSGNTQGVAALVVGMKVEDAIALAGKYFENHFKNLTFVFYFIALKPESF